MRRWRGRLIAALAAALAIVAAYAARDRLLPLVARWLDVGQTPHAKADYALVLGGDTATRPLAAAALWKAGWARRILVTHIETCAVNEAQIVPHYHDQAQALLARRGVRADAIEFIGRRCATTYDEVCSLRAFLDAHPTARVIVVTSFFHTRRTEWILRRVLGADMARVTVVSAPLDIYDANNWWRVECGLMAVPSEYPKLLFYLLRYGALPYWLAGLLALGIAWWLVRRMVRERFRREPPIVPVQE